LVVKHHGLPGRDLVRMGKAVPASGRAVFELLHGDGETEAMPTYFHTTDAAAAILRDGFRDGTGSYLLASLTLTGVFLADMPVDVNEGARGDQVLAVELPDDLDLDPFELIEDMKPYREWCVPAQLVNEHGAVRMLSQDELDEMWMARGDE
jgi:hypothetical protein